jgi:hypothetical protein
MFFACACQDTLDERRKTSLEFFRVEPVHQNNSLFRREDDTALAQDTEVMGERRFRHNDVEFATGTLAGLVQLPNNLKAHRV